jgi:hypothetical protein
MALSAIARFTRSIGRRCMARPAGAALTALALGGAIAGGAMAISPTVETTRVFRGGVTIVGGAFDGEHSDVYTVPAGRKFMLTDLVIANRSQTGPAMAQYVYTGQGASCTTVFALKTSFLHVPAASTLHLPFVTGIGFTAGQHVCIKNEDDASVTDWTIRGYLFD